MPKGKKSLAAQAVGKCVVPSARRGQGGPVGFLRRAAAVAAPVAGAGAGAAVAAVAAVAVVATVLGQRSAGLGEQSRTTKKCTKYGSCTLGMVTRQDALDSVGDSEHTFVLPGMCGNASM
jgi:hypothetical protein